MNYDEVQTGGIDIFLCYKGNILIISAVMTNLFASENKCLSSYVIRILYFLI